MGFCVATTTPTPKARACFISATSGRLVGGLAGWGGRKPYTSSNTNSARRRCEPGKVRTHDSTSSSSTPSTSARSSSSRWATLTITVGVLPCLGREPLGDVEGGALAPAGERGRGEQRVERGRQLRALVLRHERIDRERADLVRSAGSSTSCIKRAELGALPGRQPPLGQHAQQHVLAALGRIGIAPEQPQHQRDGGAERVARGLRIASQRGERRSSDDSTCSGSPADPPGVSTRTSRAGCVAASSGSPMPHRSSAAPSLCAESAARPREPPPALSASALAARPTARRAAARSSETPSSKFGKSPFTSITMVGHPRAAASSTITVTRPVLPLPVMPTTTPCVTKCSAGNQRARPPSAAVQDSATLPGSMPVSSSCPCIGCFASAHERTVRPDIGGGRTGQAARP